MRISEVSIILAAILVASFASTTEATLVQWLVADGGNGHFYEPFSVSGGITWTEANVAATSKGGYLATITSQAENDFVFNLVDDEIFWFEWVSLQGPWLGGYQPGGSSEPDGGWRWVTEESFNYTNWYEGQPDNWAWNDCTEQDQLHFFSKTQRQPTWNDNWDNCPTKLPHGYVVEIVPEPTTLLLLGFGGLALLRRRRQE